MAKKPQESLLTAAFVEEVEEDIRQEKIKKMWRRFGPPAATVAALIVLGVFSWSFYINAKEQKSRDLSDQFLKAMEQVSLGQTETAQQIFKNLSQSSVKGYEFSSLMALAYQNIQKGDISKALGYYDLIIQGQFDEAYKNLARVLAAQTSVGMEYYANYQDDIEKISASNLALKWSAREVKALHFISLSKMDLAKSELKNLAESTEVPADIRVRAQMILEVIEG